MRIVRINRISISSKSGVLQLLYKPRKKILIYTLIIVLKYENDLFRLYTLNNFYKSIVFLKFLSMGRVLYHQIK